MQHRWLANLSRDTRVVLLGCVDNYLQTDRLQDYRPYPKQAEFHAAGLVYRNRLLSAGNQQGKTYSAGDEAAMHLTGEYPPWWVGKRFNHPITLWAAGETAEATRDNAQRMLLGLPKQVGTGVIPKRCLTSIFGRSRGAADLYDYYMIRHISGGMSMLKFRYYAQDREAWQGPPVHVVWFDEEPPSDIYEEGLARTIAVKGITMMTFTPLKGFSEVVNLYWKDPNPETSGRHHTKMGINDALHLTEEEREAEIARWPKHQRRARIEGEPALGEGLIYPYNQEDVEIDPIKIADHWLRIAAIDFGGTSATAHPTAAALLAYDREADIVYLIREYRRKSLKPPEHWLSLRHWGDDLKWAWPRDGIHEEKTTGNQLIEMYRSEGMKVLPIHAQYPGSRRRKRGNQGGGTTLSTLSVERGILDIQTRIDVDRFKVFSTCPLFFEEMRQYHRVEGKIIKTMDDIMDAVRYGIMMLRFADVPTPTVYRNREAPDWQIGI